MKTIRYELHDGIATITFDEPDSPVNTMCADWQRDLSTATGLVVRDKGMIKGVILARQRLPAGVVERAVGKGACQRQQFGRDIASFGLVREKIAQMTVDCFAAESAVWMVAHFIDSGHPDYSVEAAISKVFASEAMQRAANSIDLPLIAERVETEGEWQVLRTMGISGVQGRLVRLADQDRSAWDPALIAEGQAITVMWRGKPVFVRHRSKADIEAARAAGRAPGACPLSPARRNDRGPSAGCTAAAAGRARRVRRAAHAN